MIVETDFSFCLSSESDSLQSVVQEKYAGNNAGINIMLSPRPSGAQLTTIKEIPNKVLQDRPCAGNGTGHNHTDASISGSAPASK